MTRRLPLFVTAAALACAGGYVFVYLWRWEWHRALVAGVLFLGAEVALVGALVLERLRRIEDRVDALAASDAAAVSQVQSRLAEHAPPPREPFAWLAPDDGRLGVFVPLLLGAGVLLSGLAWVVERLARATAGPLLERRVAVAFAPLTVPPGVFTPTPVVPPPTTIPRLWPKLGLVVVAFVSIGIGVDALADATQTRPDPVLPVSSTTRVVFAVEHARVGPDLFATASHLWGTCAPQLSARHRLMRLEPVPGGVAAVVAPGVGPYAERRLRGCLRDAVLDRVRGDVRAIELNAR